MNYAILPSRALITLAGEGVIDFLQGLISNDARLLEKGQAIYSALLSPQGRFLHDFFLTSWQGKIWLEGEAARINDLTARLKLYRLRSNIAIEPAGDYCVGAFWGEGMEAYEDAAIKIFPDPRLGALGYRAIGTKQAIEDFSARSAYHKSDAEEYDRHRLSLGVPDSSRDMIVERSLLLECGFEELHGVNFPKGCYVGQEVTARSKFRGQLRKGFYIVQGQSPLPPPGTPVLADETAIGEMRSSNGTIGLAVIRGENPTGNLRAGDAALFLARPAWAAPLENGEIAP